MRCDVYLERLYYFQYFDKAPGWHRFNGMIPFYGGAAPAVYPQSYRTTMEFIGDDGKSLAKFSVPYGTAIFEARYRHRTPLVARPIQR